MRMLPVVIPVALIDVVLIFVFIEFGIVAVEANNDAVEINPVLRMLAEVILVAFNVAVVMFVSTIFGMVAFDAFTFDVVIPLATFI